MKKSRWLVFLVLTFLIQYISPCEVSSEQNTLVPQLKTGVDLVNVSFRQISESVYTGLALYKLDAINHLPKDQLTAFLHTGGGHPGVATPGVEVRFDIANMDMGKKGCTRYYPFSIGERNFIMRICLTEELRYQPKATVLYEGALERPAVTFQILPSLNEILSTCKPEPVKIYPPSPVGKSS